MTGPEPPIERLLMAWDGSVVEPPGLAAVIADPDGVRTDGVIGRLQAAAQADFGDIPQALAALARLPSREIARLASRLEWTVRAISEWDPRRDRHGLGIEGALASVVLWNADGSFWEAVRPRLEGRAIPKAALAIVLRTREPNAHVPDDAPVWEREHLAALQTADRAGDWEQLVQRAQAFQRLPILDGGARQAVLALSVLDRSALLRIVNRIEGWLHGSMLLQPLALANALSIAAESTNGHVRFATLERVAYRERRTLDRHEERALRNLFIVLARNAAEWPRWLAAFNRHPVRHPHMQASLGKALARSADHALRAYVEAIDLNPADRSDRACVTDCLSAFRDAAVAARRLVLWRSGHDRWREWNFGASDRKELVAIGRSALDYAVVGWLVEGNVQGPSERLESDFADGLQALDAEWHASISTAISGFLRLVSCYQVLAHGTRRLPEDADWLPGPAVVIPHAASDAFVQRRYLWDGSASI